MWRGFRLLFNLVLHKDIFLLIQLFLITCGDVDDLKAALSQAQSADDQNAALVAFLSDAKPAAKAKAATAPKQKFEFHVGATKVTARRGECRILSGDDFSSVPRERLEAAVRAFEAALKPE